MEGLRKRTGILSKKNFVEEKEKRSSRSAPLGEGKGGREVPSPNDLQEKGVGVLSTLSKRHRNKECPSTRKGLRKKRGKYLHYGEPKERIYEAALIIAWRGRKKRSLVLCYYEEKTTRPHGPEKPGVQKEEKGGDDLTFDRAKRKEGRG